jgi:hypothetical protein
MHDALQCSRSFRDKKKGPERAGPRANRRIAIRRHLATAGTVYGVIAIPRLAVRCQFFAILRQWIATAAVALGVGNRRPFSGVTSAHASQRERVSGSKSLSRRSMHFATCARNLERSNTVIPRCAIPSREPGAFGNDADQQVTWIGGRCGRGFRSLGSRKPYFACRNFLI